MKHTATYIMAHAVLIAVPMLLAVGSWLGFPNDRMLGGFYWMFAALWKGLEMTFERDDPSQSPRRSLSI